MLTVCCWFWRQEGVRVAYDPLHVRVWADMVRRNLSGAYRLAVVTHEELDIPGVDVIRPPRDFEDIRIPTWPEFRPQCLRRLVMFRKDAAEIFGDEILCMDLDLVIAEPLDQMLEGEFDFRIAVGTAPGRPYNGSLIYIRAGKRPQVYDSFSIAGALEAGQKFVGSDQAWIAHCLGPDEATWSERDGLVFNNVAHSPGVERKLVFYPGAAKPWHKMNDPWVAKHYRMTGGGGKCLVLGYDDNLWSDVEVALNQGPYDAVISSPEAAMHWPGKILAVAHTNKIAADLAHMHGFDRVTFCGVSA